MTPFAAKVRNASRREASQKALSINPRSVGSTPGHKWDPRSPYRRPRRITFMIVSMRPIVQHMGQPFHKKRTAGSRMTDSHSALLMVRIARYSPAKPRNPRNRWIPMVLLPKNTPPHFPLTVASYSDRAVLPSVQVRSWPQAGPPLALPLSDFRPGESYPCDQCDQF